MSAAEQVCRVCGGAYGAGELYCPADGARLAVPALVSDANASDPLVGETLDGRYLVLSVIGRGGMGVVYEAEHLEIGKRVAIKALRRDLIDRADLTERFRREARAVSRIGHPHVIEVSDFGQTRFGACYFVMELLKGADLADTLSRERVLHPTRAARIAVQCCAGLAAAHAQHLVHRDLKPENVFLCRTDKGGDDVRLVDFGVAKIVDADSDDEPARRLTRTGIVFGTPEYMSPEQARGEALDERVDVYALGVLMFEMVTGRVPFEGANFMELLRKHTDEPVPPLTARNPAVEVSDAFARVIYRALHKDREHRYASMSHLAQDLRLVPELRRNSDVRPLVMASAAVVKGAAHMAASAPPSAPTAASVAPTSDPLDDAPTQELQALSACAEADAEGDAQHTDSFGGASDADPARRRGFWGVTAVAAALVLAAIVRSQGDATGAPVQLLPQVLQGAKAGPLAGVIPSTMAPPPTDEQVPSFAFTRLRVTSRPSGARVAAHGAGELCPATPCTVTVARHEPLRLRLRLPGSGAKAESRITPSDPLQKVRVVFKRPAHETDPLLSDLKVPAALR